LAKKLAFWARIKAKLCENWVIKLVFEKNVIFSAENWQKSQKIGENRRKLAKIAQKL
jgi:hypothetical protein